MPDNVLPVNTCEEIRKIKKIPVRNLWLLMLYASGLFRELSEKNKVDIDDYDEDVSKLIAEILCRRVEKRIKYNLGLGYQQREDILNRMRGRVDFLKTQQLIEKGKLACRFYELTVNTPRNRYVRSALKRIAMLVPDRDLRHRCLSLAESLRRLGVSGECYNHRDPAIDTFGLNDAGDQLMVSAARLAFELILPDEISGARLMFLPDSKEFFNLYEKGIAGFYDVVLSGRDWNVHPGKELDWQIQSPSAGIGAIFPGMKTDIILENNKRRIIIDTKSNAIVTQGWKKKRTLRSGYIYQMYAYLRSQEGRGNRLDDKAAGILLHPAVGEMLDESAVIQNHKIRFVTVDLSAPAKEIRKRLLWIIESNE